MFARSWTAAGPRERGWSRAVPEVSCERPLPNKSPAQSYSHPFLRSLPWSLFCVVHDLCTVSPRRIPSIFQFSRILRDKLPFVSMMSRVTALRGDLGVRIIAAARRPCHLLQDTLVFIQVLHLARHSGVPFSSLSHKKHTNSKAPLVHDESTSTRSRCSSAARLHGSIVTVKTQASSRLSGHRARVILSQSIIIALYFGVFLLLAQHARAVFARISVRESQNPV